MDTSDNTTSKAYREQGSPIMLFNYGHLLFATNKRKDQFQTLELRIEH
jgi:hypothetical protein